MVFALQAEGESISKLEKADVLELTVNYRDLQGGSPHRQGARAEGAQAHEGRLTQLRLRILFGQGLYSITKYSTSSIFLSQGRKNSLEAFLNMHQYYVY